MLPQVLPVSDALHPPGQWNMPHERNIDLINLKNYIEHLPEYKKLLEREKLIHESRYQTSEAYLANTQAPHFLQNIVETNGLEFYVESVCIVIKNIIETRQEGETSEQARSLYNKLIQYCLKNNIRIKRINFNPLPISLPTALPSVAAHGIKRSHPVVEQDKDPRKRKPQSNEDLIKSITEQNKKQLQMIQGEIEKRRTNQNAWQANVKNDIVKLERDVETKTKELEAAERAVEEARGRLTAIKAQLESRKSQYDAKLQEFQEITSERDILAKQFSLVEEKLRSIFEKI